MLRLMKHLFWAAAFLFVSVAAFAQKVEFEANAPAVVAVGEAFRIEFSLNAKPEEFVPPTFDGFDVVAGPTLSEGTSVSIVNGNVTKTSSFTYTYVIQASSVGKASISAASVRVDGKSYGTQPLTIEVIADEASARPGAAGGEKQAGEARSAKLGADDLLVRVAVNRNNVFKGQPIRATFKIYTRVQLGGLDNVKYPAFNGFWVQDLDVQGYGWQRETLNGKVYDAKIIREVLLYPQQAGTLVIEPAEITAVAQVVIQSRRSLDPFFGGGHDFVNVPRKVQSPRINVTVKPLPAGAPASFSGAVGSFAMDAVLPPDRLAANSAATYTVKISGTGNLTFVQAPKLTLPASFEQYNVKTTESINASAAGISGYRQFEYPFIARAEGTYEVEPVEFSYFDPARMQYMTLRSRPLELEITPDAKGGGGDAYVVQGRGMSKEEVKMLGQDIRFIKLGNAQLRPVREPFLFGAVYWVLLFGILAFFTAVYVALRKQIRESQNAALVRGKRANKVAVQRFRVAKRYMEEQNRHAFYEEMLRALWGYMGDKFNIPVANLTKENVREELHKRGVSVEESQRFTSIITKCDEAQYSPAASAQMSEVYAEGVDIISRIEAVIKR